MRSCCVNLDLLNRARLQFQEPLGTIAISLRLRGSGFRPIQLRERRAILRARIADFIGVITRQDLTLMDIISQPCIN